jgi:hypothetical protein
VKNTARKAVGVDHVASARMTRRRVVSGNGEIGRQATTFGRGAARRRVLAAGSAVAMEHAATVWTRQRFENGFENRCGRNEIREKSDGDFLF